MSLILDFKGIFLFPKMTFPVKRSIKRSEITTVGYMPTRPIINGILLYLCIFYRETLTYNHLFITSYNRVLLNWVQWRLFGTQKSATLFLPVDRSQYKPCMLPTLTLRQWHLGSTSTHHCLTICIPRGFRGTALIAEWLKVLPTTTRCLSKVSQDCYCAFLGNHD